MASHSEGNFPFVRSWVTDASPRNVIMFAIEECLKDERYFAFPCSDHPDADNECEKMNPPRAFRSLFHRLPPRPVTATAAFAESFFSHKFHLGNFILYTISANFLIYLQDMPHSSIKQQNHRSSSIRGSVPFSIWFCLPEDQT